MAFVESNEPRPIIYAIYFDEAATRMTVAQVHPDSESMEYHMTVAGPAFAGFAELVTLSTLDIYGEPSEALLEQLRRKVQLLGAGDRGGPRSPGRARPPRPALTSDHDSMRAVS